MAAPSSARGSRCQRTYGLDRAIVVVAIVAAAKTMPAAKNAGSLTDLIQLDGVEFRAHLVEEGLGGSAVRAVGFAEDGWKELVSQKNLMPMGTKGRGRI